VFWFSLLGAVGDHEATDEGDEVGKSKVGMRSHASWLGEVIGGENLPAVLRELKARAEGERERELQTMVAPFEAWPPPWRRAAEALARWLFGVEQHDLGYPAFAEYAQRLVDAPIEENMARCVRLNHSQPFSPHVNRPSRSTLTLDRPARPRSETGVRCALAGTTLDTLASTVPSSSSSRGGPRSG